MVDMTSAPELNPLRDPDGFLSAFERYGGQVVKMIECCCTCNPNHGCGGAVCSPATSAPSACRLAAEAPFITKISIALPGVEPRFLKP